MVVGSLYSVSPFRLPSTAFRALSDRGAVEAVCSVSRFSRLKKSGLLSCTAQRAAELRVPALRYASTAFRSKTASEASRLLSDRAAVV